MPKEPTKAREGGVMGLRSRNAVGGRTDRAHGRATLPAQNGLRSGISTLRAEADRIRSSSGITLSDNARELRYGSREWDSATNEGAWRSYRTQDGRSFFLKYDGSMFYERKKH